RCQAGALRTFEALVVALEKLRHEPRLEARLDAREPLAMSLRVGGKRACEAALDGIEALSRQCEQVFETGQAACGSLQVRARGLDRAVDAFRQAKGKIAEALDEITVLRHC